MGEWHAADDLVQQTLITIYRRWDRLDRHDNLSAYTRTVMVRHFLGDRRKHRWTHELLRSALPEPDPTPEEAARVGDRLVLLAALATLSPRQRSLVYLRYWDDVSVEETARIMNCSLSTVRSSTSRALGILRTRLTELSPRTGSDAPRRQPGTPRRNMEGGLREQGSSRTRTTRAR